MKLPYVINIFMWKFGDKYSKKLMISIILVLVSFLYVSLWFHEWFYTILVLTFFISLWIAILNPLTSALVISYTEPKDKWSIAWVEEFVWRIGDIAGSLWFGILTWIIWLQKWFIVTWICTFWLWMYLMIKKLVSYKSKNNEREKIK
jgi:MFS family permease